jgi:hypothetical protein
MMKQLPDKFQMRTDDFPGFTHTVKLNAHGDYEVTWARGFDRKSYSMGRKLPNVVFAQEEVLDAVQSLWWVIVEDTPKQKGANLPDEFYFLNSQDYTFKAERDLRTKYFNFESIDSPYSSKGAFSESEAQECLKCGLWKILDKPSLTAEQQRALNEFKEQVAQLDQSIKLNEQDVEHKLRLIGNYRARQDELRAKIKELEGV